MKRFKKILSGILVIAMCFLTVNTKADAAEYNLGDIIDGSMLTGETFSGSQASIAPRGAYLSHGTSAIADRGNGVIAVSGNTFCHQYVDRAEVTVYVERLYNGQWTSVTYRTGVSYNSTGASYGTTLSVTKGYYYRVQSGHVAVKGGVYENNVSYTNSIYIG